MYDSIIPVFSQIDCAGAKFINQSLPSSLTDKCGAVQQTTVNKDDDVLVAHLLANVNKTVLQGRLEFDETKLEAKALLLGEI